MSFILFLVFLQGEKPQDEHLEAVRKAAQKTADAGYAFEVKGKYERAGEWLAPGVLTSRIKQYQSARNGERILVKGPEGLWKTPDERLGERVQNPDPEAGPIVRLLQETEAPHRILEAALRQIAKGRPPDDREVDGLFCRRYVFNIPVDPLKEYISAHMDKAIKAGTMARPDEIRWSSTMKGNLAVYVAKKDGQLVKVKDERSVKVAYKVPDSQPELKSYRLEMEIDFSGWGEAKVQLPPEVKERLEIKQ